MLENLTQQMLVSSLGIAELFDEYPHCAIGREASHPKADIHRNRAQFKAGRKTVVGRDLKE
ncbi:hypothetical protein ABLO27_08345 [Roseibium sp. SCPC15]|uniref:hypothetical protein n=1 Tax=Roseibium sp. SCP15 TaxID=3141376 RepID=UPI0033399724